MSAPGGKDDDDLEATRPGRVPAPPPLPRIPGVTLQHEIARGGNPKVNQGMISSRRLRLHLILQNAHIERQLQARVNRNLCEYNLTSPSPIPQCSAMSN